MTYKSVDDIQNLLAETVFKHTESKKKAAGRALGTIVEIITYYLLDAWGVSKAVIIEQGVQEYGNPSISHNLEYSLHPVLYHENLALSLKNIPITGNKVLEKLKEIKFPLQGLIKKNNVLLSRDLILRNACLIANSNNSKLTCMLKELKNNELNIDCSLKHDKPYAIVECKRVGVEEGARKGPQTIEKAKQGAYVAKTVSSLQKIRTPSGEQYGVMIFSNGQNIIKPYSTFLNEIMNSEKQDLLMKFIMTIGVVSNHGNWFTSKNQNKELLVLAQSYDWLLFLSDEGLSTFVHEVLHEPDEYLSVAKKAFLLSYAANKKSNQFTKVKIALDAHFALRNYFKKNLKKVQSWFNIITPENKDIQELREQINLLANKPWSKILEQ